MLHAIRLIYTDVTIRIVSVTLLCLGFTFASSYPYFSIIAVQQLGMAEKHYALMLIVMAVVAMVGSLLIGHFSDRATDRKRGILIALAVGCFGFGLFAFAPSLTTFLICMLLVIPISTSAYGQLFAVIRARIVDRDAADATSISSTVRTFYALSWILVPGFVGAFLATRQNMSDSFAVAALAYALCFVVYLVFGSSGGRATPSATPAWQSLVDALRLVRSAPILLRVLSLALIASVHASNAALLPLFIIRMPGTTLADVGIIAGLVAGLEIPFMLAGGYFGRHFALWKIIVAAGVVHGAYLLGLSIAISMPHVYGLVLLNAAGAAIMLSLHLNYVQNLMPDRPGLGTSLLSIASLVNRCLGAIVFAIAGTGFGFSGAALVGAGLALLGCAGLFVLDRNSGRLD